MSPAYGFHLDARNSDDVPNGARFPPALPRMEPGRQDTGIVKEWDHEAAPLLSQAQQREELRQVDEAFGLRVLLRSEQGDRQVLAVEERLQAVGDVGRPEAGEVVGEIHFERQRHLQGKRSVRRAAL